MNSRISTMISEKSKIAAYALMAIPSSTYHSIREKDWDGFARNGSTVGVERARGTENRIAHVEQTVLSIDKSTLNPRQLISRGISSVFSYVSDVAYASWPT